MPGPDRPLEGFGAQDGIELVQKVPLFRALTFDETRRLFAIATPETRRAGEVIVDADALGQALIYRAFCRTLSDRLRRANALLPADQRLAHGVQ